MIGIAMGAAIGVALLVGVVSASTAGNTVTETRAGVGEGAVTGYNVSSVHYVLNASNPMQLDAVTLSLGAVFLRFDLHQALECFDHLVLVHGERDDRFLCDNQSAGDAGRGDLAGGGGSAVGASLLRDGTANRDGLR